MSAALSQAAAPQPLSRVAYVADLFALTKPRVTALVVATTAGGLWLAPGHVPASIWLVVLLATAAVVGAANTLNCYIERDIDRLMERTRQRPLPSGRIAPRVALWLGIGLGVLSVPALALFTNALAAVLAAFALLSYVLLYTPMKQRSHQALYVGAIPGAIPPLIGWTAATGRITLPGAVLFAILFLWQLPHFVAIAIFRKDDYERAGLRVLPLEKGERVAKVVSVLSTALLVPVSLSLLPLGVAGWLYGSVAGALGLAFLVWCIYGMRDQVTPRFFRRLFYLSLAYLTLLFAALVVDTVGVTARPWP